MQDTQITKYDEQLNALAEQVRFYISTPERFAEALVFVKKLEKFAEEIKEKVKNRGHELMNDENLTEIEFGDFKVMKVEPTEVTTYLPESILNTLPMEEALPLLKVNTAKLKLYIKKNKIESETLGKLIDGNTKKTREGYIRLVEKKTKK